MTDLAPAPATRAVGTPGPAPRRVRDLLEEVLGREVQMRHSEPFLPGPFLPASLGVYTDRALRVVTIALLDLQLSALGGAAAARLSGSSALPSLTAMRLERPIEVGLQRILVAVPDILAGPGEEPPRVYEMHPVGRPTPEHLVARAQARGGRQDFTVTIPGFGTGRFSLVHS